MFPPLKLFLNRKTDFLSLTLKQNLHKKKSKILFFCFQEQGLPKELSSFSSLPCLAKLHEFLFHIFEYNFPSGTYSLAKNVLLNNFDFNLLFFSLPSIFGSNLGAVIFWSKHQVMGGISIISLQEVTGLQCQYNCFNGCWNCQKIMYVGKVGTFVPERQCEDLQCLCNFQRRLNLDHFISVKAPSILSQLSLSRLSILFLSHFKDFLNLLS